MGVLFCSTGTRSCISFSTNASSSWSSSTSTSSRSNSPRSGTLFVASGAVFLQVCAVWNSGDQTSVASWNLESCRCTFWWRFHSCDQSQSWCALLWIQHHPDLLELWLWCNGWCNFCSILPSCWDSSWSDWGYLSPQPCCHTRWFGHVGSGSALVIATGCLLLDGALLSRCWTFSQGKLANLEWNTRGILSLTCLFFCSVD